MPVMMTHDTSIDYDIHGDGPPLLLIGGLGFGRWAWFKQIPALSRYFRTITFDIRGEHGLARGVPDLSVEAAALLDHLGVEKAHVLGTSLGGFVAQELALERPELVDRLVLICTSYGGVGPEPISVQALGKMLGWGASSPESAVRSALETATSDAYRAERPEEFDVILRWRLADSPSSKDYSRQAMAGARFDISRDVRAISSPTLVIHGADDPYIPLANAVALADAIPGAELRVLDGARHLVFIEQYEKVNKEIISFLDPQKRRRFGIWSAKQKTKNLLAELSKPEARALPFLGSREKSQEAEESSPPGRLKPWLIRKSRVPVHWTKRLRGWLSR